MTETLKDHTVVANVKDERRPGLDDKRPGSSGNMSVYSEAQSTNDDFADAQEDSASRDPSPQPLARQLTRNSTSTIASISSRRSVKDNTSTNGVKSSSGSIAESANAPSLRKSLSAESLDEVSLNDEPPKPTSPPSPPAIAESVSSSVSSLVNRFSRGSVSSSTTIASKDKPVPAAPAAPAPPAKEPTPTPPAIAPVRRNPFSWLRGTSSSSNVNKETASPPAQEQTPVAVKRATNSSILTTSTASHDKEELARNKETLRENFKKIKERELGVVDGEGGELTPVAATASEASTEPTTITNIKEEEEENAIDWDLWQSVLDDEAPPASPSELTKAIQAGIPQTIRGLVWQALAQSKCLELEKLYREVLALPASATAEEARLIFGSYSPPMPSKSSANGASPRMSTPRAGTTPNSPKPFTMPLKTVAQLEKQIKKDLGERTSFGRYKIDQKALMNVCKAYALYDPEVGYTQGMTFVATVLLLNMSEEEAFCLFVAIMCKYDLRSMFTERMKGLELRLYQYDRILEDHEPRLAIHLRRQNIESSLYAAQWFLTLFTYRFPLQLVMRVFDLIFGESLESAILKFGVLLMRKNSKELLSMDFETLGPFLKERLFDVYIDTSPSASSVREAGFFGNGGETCVYRANEMVIDACEIVIPRSVLDRYEEEWVDQEKIRRDREEEVESLRTANASLTSRVKMLETQLDTLNAEHVELANEMVAKKVENGHLSDEVEALTQEVEELKKIVDTQPAEVEARLRMEMDRILQRNLEVHNEMQVVEEHATQTEKELIEAKMELATINEAHEQLKARWNDLKKALGD